MPSTGAEDEAHEDTRRLFAGPMRDSETVQQAARDVYMF